jgi:hypothetical protein
MSKLWGISFADSNVQVGEHLNAQTVAMCKLCKHPPQLWSVVRRRTAKQLSAKMSRNLRLLRIHGIIRKLPKQNRYQMTLKGVRLTNAMNALLAASTENLLKMAA